MAYAGDGEDKDDLYAPYQPVQQNMNAPAPEPSEEDIASWNRVEQFTRRDNDDKKGGSDASKTTRKRPMAKTEKSEIQSVKRRLKRIDQFTPFQIDMELCRLLSIRKKEQVKPIDLDPCLSLKQKTEQIQSLTGNTTLSAYYDITTVAEPSSSVVDNSRLDPGVVEFFKYVEECVGPLDDDESDWMYVDTSDGSKWAIHRTDESKSYCMRPARDLDAVRELAYQQRCELETTDARDQRLERQSGRPRSDCLAWFDKAALRHAVPTVSMRQFILRKSRYIQSVCYLPSDFESDPVYGCTHRTRLTRDERVVMCFHLRLLDRKNDTRERDPDFVDVSQMSILSIDFLPVRHSLMGVNEHVRTFYRAYDDGQLVLGDTSNEYAVRLAEVQKIYKGREVHHNNVVLMRTYQTDPLGYIHMKATYNTKWCWKEYLSVCDQAKMARVSRRYRTEFGRVAEFMRPLHTAKRTRVAVPAYEWAATEGAVRALFFLLGARLPDVGTVAEWAHHLVRSQTKPPGVFPAWFFELCKFVQLFHAPTNQRELLEAKTETPRSVFDKALGQLGSMVYLLNETTPPEIRVRFSGDDLINMAAFVLRADRCLPVLKKVKVLTETLGDCVWWPRDLNLRMSVVNRTQHQKLFYLSVVPHPRRIQRHFYAIEFQTGIGYRGAIDVPWLDAAVFKITRHLGNGADFDRHFPTLALYFPRVVEDGPKATADADRDQSSQHHKVFRRETPKTSAAPKPKPKIDITRFFQKKDK